MSYQELQDKYDRLKAAGKTLSNSKEFAKVYKQLKADPTYQLVNELTKQVVELDRQISDIPAVELTDQEKAAFLNKAIEEITPYYNSKRAEIEAGIKEGKVRTAEEILTTQREVEESAKEALAKFDLNQAETEEDFLNQLADLTSTTNEEMVAKKTDFKQRIEDLKVDQVQSGILTSGIGRKAVGEEQDIASLEEQALLRGSEAQKTKLESAKKYNLESIQLARKAAEAERVRQIGTPEEAAATQQSALQTAGYSSLSELPSATELLRLQKERGISPIDDKTALTDLERERIKAQEATKEELEEDELARRDVEYQAQLRKIEAEKAAKASKLSAVRGY
jgi:hypothetical protein